MNSGLKCNRIVSLFTVHGLISSSSSFGLCASSQQNQTKWHFGYFGMLQRDDSCWCIGLIIWVLWSDWGPFLSGQRRHSILEQNRYFKFFSWDLNQFFFQVKIVQNQFLQNICSFRIQPKKYTENPKITLKIFKTLKILFQTRTNDPKMPKI